ncbi:MAG TPA: 50S ribosomal protein L23 [Candidatus Norongarragalinales archaeon]|jgi:large subunit ribosomal protein L23|nr:50S ribosomal protein L23 [Candidatus Norongarragalinales archaeon]
MVSILYALTTEKAVGSIERQNQLTFVVARESDKSQIKQEFEKLYAEKVKSVNTTIDAKGKKKAFIKLKRKGAASDVAGKLKIL